MLLSRVVASLFQCADVLVIFVQGRSLLIGEISSDCIVERNL